MTFAHFCEFRVVGWIDKYQPFAIQGIGILASVSISLQNLVFSACFCSTYTNCFILMGLLRTQSNILEGTFWEEI